jgi:hypothetical protein
MGESSRWHFVVNIGKNWAKEVYLFGFNWRNLDRGLILQKLGGQMKNRAAALFWPSDLDRMVRTATDFHAIISRPTVSTALNLRLVGASKEEKRMGSGRAADDDHHWTEVDGSPFVSAFSPPTFVFAPGWTLLLLCRLFTTDMLCSAWPPLIN